MLCGRILQIDTYETLAELSVALIGFSALVGAFGSAARPESPFERHAIRTLVELALIAFLLSLLPVALVAITQDHEQFWRICSGISALLIGGNFAYRTTTTRNLPVPRRTEVAGWVGAPFVLVLVVLNILNSANFLSEVAEWPFRTSVIVQLCNSTLFFFLRFFPMEPDDSAA